MTSTSLAIPLREVRGPKAALAVFAGFLALCLSGCGSAASPRWAGAVLEEAYSDSSETVAVRPPERRAPTVPPVPPVQPLPNPVPPAGSTSRPPVAAPTGGPAVAPPGSSQTPDEVEVPVPALVPSNGSEYRIGIGDEIQVNLPFDATYSSKAVVRRDGRITAPLLGDVLVAGHTPAEVDTALTRAYGRLYRYPVVTVSVEKVAANQVYIMGEVNLPGAVEIPGNMTLLQLIGKAGGVRTSGTLKSVILMRRGPGNVVIARRVNVNRIMEGREDSPDIQLAATDVAFVPRSFVGKLNLFVEQWVTGFVGPVANGYLRGWEVLQPDRFFFNPNLNRPSSATGTGASQ